MHRIILLLIAALGTPGASAQHPDVETLRTSCVEILSDGQLAGTGWIASTNGAVLTAAHTIGHTPTGRRFEIRLRDGTRRPMRVEAIDFGHDVCRLNPLEPVRSVPLPFATSLPRPAQTVHLFGAPLFRHEILITGHMARSRPTYEYSDGHYCRCVFTSGIAPKGTSGGPWINRRGQVFGLQSAVMNDGKSYQGLCMVAPLDALQQILGADGHAHTASIEAATEEMFEQSPAFNKACTYKQPALVLRQVVKGGVAEQAGIKEYKLLTGMNGTAYETRDAFLSALRRHKPGDAIKLSIRDKTGANPHDVTIKLARLEAAWAK